MTKLLRPEIHIDQENYPQRKKVILKIITEYCCTQQPTTKCSNKKKFPVKATNIESDKKPQKSSITTTTTTTYVLQQSFMIPPPRKKRRLRNVSRGGTPSTTFAKRNIKNRKRQKLLGTCICS